MTDEIRNLVPAPAEGPEKEVHAIVDIGEVNVRFKHELDAIEIRGGGLTGNEMAAMALINDLLRRLRLGRSLEYDFDPNSLMDHGRLVTCRWLTSGNLKIENEPPIRHFNHAVTVDEALSRPRSFTTTLAIANCLPRNRRMFRVTKEIASIAAAQNSEAHQ